MIFCRNFFIYIIKPSQEKLLKILESHLVHGGLLILGKTKMIVNTQSSFKSIDTNNHFYIKGQNIKIKEKSQKTTKKPIKRKEIITKTINKETEQKDTKKVDKPSEKKMVKIIEKRVVVPIEIHKKQKIKSREKKLDQREMQIIRRLNQIEVREKQLKEKELQLNQREIQLEQREILIGLREKQLEQALA